MLWRGLPADAAVCAPTALQAHDPATDGDWNVRRLIALQGGSPLTLQICQLQGWSACWWTCVLEAAVWRLRC